MYVEKTGRLLWDPEIILRIMLLGYLHGCSEKRLCDEIQMQPGFCCSGAFTGKYEKIVRAAATATHRVAA